MTLDRLCFLMALIKHFLKALIKQSRSVSVSLTQGCNAGCQNKTTLTELCQTRNITYVGSWFTNFNSACVWVIYKVKHYTLILMC